MAIYGRSQLLRIRVRKDGMAALEEALPSTLDVIDRAINKIVAVLAEMKDISPIDEVEFLSTSKAMNMDSRIQKRLEAMESDSGLVLPEEVAAET